MHLFAIDPVIHITPLPVFTLNGYVITNSMLYGVICSLIITVLLITSPRGHILLDGATAEAAPSIAANIERLGFKLTDVKLIGASHAHYDHVGGIAELQRRTGATLMAMSSAYVQLQTGQLDKYDPQFCNIAAFPAAIT